MTTRDVSSLFGSTIDYPGVPSTAHPGGKLYRVPSPSAELGVQLTYRATLGLKQARGLQLTDDERAALALNDEDEATFYQEILGPVHDEMIADGVQWTLLQGIAGDAYLVITGNEALADIRLARAAGEALARANRATRRAATPRKKVGSKSSPASSGTPARTRNPASTRSSKSPAAKTA